VADLTEGCCTLVECPDVGPAWAMAVAGAVHSKKTRVRNSASFERVLFETLAMAMAFAFSMSGNMAGGLANANGGRLKLGLHSSHTASR
jgi:hypothetical protein